MSELLILVAGVTLGLAAAAFVKMLLDGWNDPQAEEWNVERDTEGRIERIESVSM